MSITRSLRLLYEPYEYDDQGRKRFGAWSQSYSGERYWVMDPRPEEVHLVDIVQGLANAARYRGQTKFFYPVLTHCLLVSEAVEQMAIRRGWSRAAAREASFEGLLHDAGEAYLGDVARPLKRMRAMKGYRRIEALWDHAIHEKFGIQPTAASKKLVHEADHRIVLDEIFVLMKDPDMWRRGHRYVDMEPLGIDVLNLSKQDLLTRFYDRFDKLHPLNTGDSIDKNRLFKETLCVAK